MSTDRCSLPLSSSLFLATVLAATDPRYSLSRTTSVRYARLLLQIIVASPYKNADWGAHNYKIISCGIIILFELLQSSQPNPQLEALVRQAIEIVASCDKTSVRCAATSLSVIHLEKFFCC